LYKGDEEIGFIEYISGEKSWRGFSDENYLFIHCIYIAKKINRNKDYGKLLLDECIKDAKLHEKIGIAVISGKSAMLAEKNIFLKNGFTTVESNPTNFELLIYKIKEGDTPKLNKKKMPDLYEKGFHLVYADQCPYFKKSIESILKICKKNSLNLEIHKINSAKEAQQSPSLYGVFVLIYNGDLVAEHYISEKRFMNILSKELKII